MREYEIESSLQYFTLFSFRIFMLCAKFSFLYAVYEKRMICHYQSLEKSKYTYNVVWMKAQNNLVCPLNRKKNTK